MNLYALPFSDKMTVTDPDGIGLAYYQGRGVGVDYKNSYLWFLVSDRGGSSFGSTALGEMYANGIYVEKNLEMSLYYYERAVERGRKESYCSLINICRLSRNFEKGQKYSEKANRLGLKNTYLSIADLQFECENYFEARKFYHKAYKAGYSEGAFRLSEFFENGFGCKKSTYYSNYWMLQAARLGDEDAREVLNESLCVI